VELYLPEALVLNNDNLTVEGSVSYLSVYMVMFSETCPSPLSKARKMAVTTKSKFSSQVKRETTAAASSESASSQVLQPITWR